MSQESKSLKVMVLAGGPDGEREVSLASGREVEGALREAGHEVRRRDILPGNLSALEEFKQWGGDVIFPAMHGAWGEGGGLQRILDARGLAYWGCGAEAAALCMDKYETKKVLEKAGLKTAEYELVERGGKGMTMKGAVVLKPLREGSSIDVFICKEEGEAKRRLEEMLGKYERVLVERFVKGKELTCGVLGGEEGGGVRALPVVQVVVKTEFYDYQAKYVREDTQYLFEVDMGAEVVRQVQEAAVKAHEVCGCRDLSRVDFLVDEAGRAFILEINTIPGFTSHSLVPKSAAKMGLGFSALCDRLARVGVGRKG